MSVRSFFRGWFGKKRPFEKTSKKSARLLVEHLEDRWVMDGALAAPILPPMDPLYAPPMPMVPADPMGVYSVSPTEPSPVYPSMMPPAIPPMLMGPTDPMGVYPTSPPEPSPIGILPVSPWAMPPTSTPMLGWSAITGISPDRGSSEFDFVTNAQSLTVFGMGSPGAAFILSVDGQGGTRGVIGADGQWSLPLNQILTEGAHLLRLESADGGGGVYFTRPITIDLTAPTVTLSGPAYTISRTPHFQVSLQTGDPFSTMGQVAIDIDLNRDGDYEDENERDLVQAFGDSFGMISAPPTLPQGHFFLRARSMDAAGNIGYSPTHEIRVAMISPKAEGDSSTSGPAEGYVFPPGMPLPTGPLIPPYSPAGMPSGAMPDSPGPVSPPSPPSGGGGSGQILADVPFNEVEPNNTPATANTVVLPPNDRLVISGTISSAGGLDYFQFTLGARSGVFFDIDSRETGLSTTLNSVLQLFASDGTTVIDTNDNGFDFDTGFPAPAAQPSATSADSALYRDLAAGTYFIRVAGAANTTGDYQLIIRADTDYSNTIPVLASNPSAADTLFLDFDGHASSNDAWVQANGNTPYNMPAFDFNGNRNELTPGEKLAIRNIWRTVSEDYSPFNINVTTSYSGSFADGVAFRLGIVDDDGTGVGVTGALGVAFLNSYAGGGIDDQVAWTFAPNFNQSFGGGSSGQIMATPVEQGNTTSHELGHALGLVHYGGTNGSIVAIMWTPDQGLSRETWFAGNTHSGEPPVINQDDMAVISNATNTFNYRPDDHGNTRATATVLTVAGTTYNGTGIISQIASDLDYFSFITAGVGPTTIRVDVDDYINDLDVELRLFDSAGTQIGIDDPNASFDAILMQGLAPGTYFIEVRSDGGAGEAGQYSVTINVPTLPPPPPPPPPPPGPGPGGGPALPGDIYEPNDTAELAASFGALTGSANLNTGLSINVKANGLFDRDWFTWTMGSGGTFTANLSNIVSQGSLHVRVYRREGDVLVELANSTLIGSANQSASTAVNAGDQIYVWVFGFNFATGTYNLQTTLS